MLRFIKFLFGSPVRIRAYSVKDEVYRNHPNKNYLGPTECTCRLGIFVWLYVSILSCTYNIVEYNEGYGWKKCDFSKEFFA